jgi:hypothetical protein
MAAKGYTSATLVTKELGRDLTAPQLDECADLIGQAEDWIDVQTGRAWLVASPITDELHNMYSRIVYLKNRPVISITSVTSRLLLVGAQDTVLTEGDEYELIDGPNGVLLVSAFAGASATTFFPSDHIPRGSLLKVSYTTSVPAPGDIQRAATLLVAHWMLPRLNGDTREVTSYSVGSSGDTFNVTFDKTDVPAEVMRLIHAREAILFA